MKMAPTALCINILKMSIVFTNTFCFSFTVARPMTANGVHESTEEPPNIPIIIGKISKHAKQESMYDVVVDAAKAVAQDQHHNIHLLLIPLTL